MKNKGQTAMEYLMTYGWAILIIIVVVAALYAMGVFSTKGGVACSPCFSYFAYRDYSKTATGICTAPGCLYIRNGARVIRAATLTCSVGTCDSCAASNCNAGQDIDITGLTTTGDVPITITYTDDATGVEHTDSATIRNSAA